MTGLTICTAETCSPAQQGGIVNRNSTLCTLLGIKMLVRLGICLFLGGLTSAQASVVYTQGGNPTDPADPGRDVEDAFYVSCKGNDNNSGRSPAAPWATVAKVKASAGSIDGGDGVFFERGCEWHAGTHDLSRTAWGEFGNPVVFGAYGTGNRPRLAGTGSFKTGLLSFGGSAYFVVRDLDFTKLGCHSGAHDFLIYNNVIRGDPVNGYHQAAAGCAGESHNGIFIENFVYDIGDRDGFLVHANESEGTPTLDHWWFINDIVIGNYGDVADDPVSARFEDCFDLTGAETDQQPGWPNPDPTTDIKVVKARCSVPAVPGVGTLTGRADTCVNRGHENAYYWLIGMICFDPSTSANVMGYQEDTIGWKVSGNVIFKTSGEDGDHRGLFQVQGGLDTMFSHNGTYRTSDGRHYRIYPNDSDFNYNLIYMTGIEESGGVIRLEGGVDFETCDHNFYSPAGLTIANGQTLAARIASTHCDANSAEGNVGIKIPDMGVWADPRRWHDAAFLANFVPDSSIPGSTCADTAGPFDENGNWCGLEIQPYENGPSELNVDGPDGCGWMATEWPIVGAKLAELGVAGACVESGLIKSKVSARPQPPQLFVAP